MHQQFPNVACVGMHFRGQGAINIVSLMEVGATITLQREPENAYDAYAIKCLVEDIHIGYVERGQAAWISPLVDEGYKATAVVTNFEMRKQNRHPIMLIEVSGD